MSGGVAIGAIRNAVLDDGPPVGANAAPIIRPKRPRTDAPAEPEPVGEPVEASPPKRAEREPEPEPEPRNTVEVDIPEYEGLRVVWYVGDNPVSEKLDLKRVEVERRNREINGKKLSEIKIWYKVPKLGRKPVMFETVPGRVAWYKFEESYQGDEKSAPKTTLCMNMGFTSYDEFASARTALEDAKADLSALSPSARFYRDLAAFEMHLFHIIWVGRKTMLAGLETPSKQLFKSIGGNEEEAWKHESVRRCCLSRFVTDEAERDGTSYSPSIKMNIPKLKGRYQTGLFDSCQNALEWSSDIVQPGSTVVALVTYDRFNTHGKRLVPYVEAHQVMIREMASQVRAPAFGIRQ
jgi:hypothetical protein